MQQKKRVFRAKRTLLDIFPAFLTVAIGCGLLQYGELLSTNALLNKAGWVFVILGCVSMWEFCVTTYEISQYELTIRTGMSTISIGLQNVEGLGLPKNVLGGVSSSSLKMKYQTLYRTRDITLTPVERDAFLLRLFEKCPWLGTPRYKST